MSTVKLLDEAHLRLQLGGRQATLDIPQSLQGNYNIDASMEAPVVDLQMQWVYGYRGKDCRNNLIYLAESRQLIYTMAGVVVLRHTDTGHQRHYVEHTDDVMSLAVHPDRITLASGQVAGHKKRDGKPHVRIWRADTLETVKVLGLDVFARAVSCIGFSGCDGGKRICCVDESDDHILSVWDWEKEKELCEAKSSKDPVLDVEFDPQNADKLVSCGRGQITFWDITDENKLVSKRGIFTTNVKPKYIMCVAFSPNGVMVSGDSNGTIFVWKNGSIERALLDAHEDAVFSVNFLPDGRLVSGGRGRQVVLWDEACTVAQSKLQIEEFYGPVRSVVAGPDLNYVYVGTTKNYILYGGLNFGFEPLIEGHRDEVWGLCAHPLISGFLSAADDGRIFCWDAVANKSVWAINIKFGAHCINITPDGSTVAIGCQTGNCLLLNANDGKELQNRKICREQIECCAFGPDSRLLALGSRDNSIYLMEATPNGSLVKTGVCRGHSSFILQLDWSLDGNLLRSNSGDYEILYWTMPNCEREMSDDVTGVCQWIDNSCTLTFNSLGVWRDANDGTDVNSVSVSTDGTLLASADDFGGVNLFQYPCYQFTAERKTGIGHSSHATKVIFLNDGKTLVSAGGRDMAIIQWNIV